VQHEVAVSASPGGRGKVSGFSAGDQFQHTTLREHIPDEVDDILVEGTANNDDVRIPFVATRLSRNVQLANTVMAFETADHAKPPQHGGQSAAKDLARLKHSDIHPLSLP
jgi:hypothetical protein